MSKKQILVADDDLSIVDLLRTFLEGEGYEVTEAHSGSEVLARLGEMTPDLLVMDIRMPEMSGIDVLQHMNEDNIDVPVLIMTAYGGSSNAIKAVQLGAQDYITKPFMLEDLLRSVNRLFDYRELAKEVRTLRSQLGEADPAERIVGRSPCMLEVYKTIGRVARTDATVLILGETGTGKELMAEVIHFNSAYRRGPLVKVSCAALPETLLESELFGHEKGSFTGAYLQRKGRFEMAHKGTIFLDEIGDMSFGTQQKLLRVIQEKTFERVGGNTPIAVDVRIIAATNKRLESEVAAGRFRDDLYYRLSVITLNLPPLRERKDDIPLLVEHFLGKHRYSPNSGPSRITEEAMNKLADYNWPGNVRELENTVERDVILAQGGVITSQHLVLSPTAYAKFIDLERLLRAKTPLKEIVAETERLAILHALSSARGNRSEAAKGLGLELATFETKMVRYGIPR